MLHDLLGYHRNISRNFLLQLSISSLVGSPGMSAADADHVRRVLVDSGARDYSVDLAADYASRARTHLASGVLGHGDLLLQL